MKTLVLGLLGFYKGAISPAWPSGCKYYPSCSAYATEAVQKYGPARGLWMGARVSLFAKFDMEAILAQVTARKYTVFMAVPTIYAKLVAEWDAAPADEQARASAGMSRMRLIVSGSAALPVSLLARLRTLSGHVLLERYGMTELGMALGNPLHGERRAGSVGVRGGSGDFWIGRSD